MQQWEYLEIPCGAGYHKDGNQWIEDHNLWADSAGRGGSLYRRQVEFTVARTL